MKRISNLLILAVTAAFIGIFTGSTVMAGMNYGPGNCIAANPNINISSEPVIINGLVKSIAPGSPGMVIRDGSADITVYGIGPVWYWRSLGAARPGIGQKIRVNAYKITFPDGTSRLVAASVTLNSRTVELRNAKTGRPMWIMCKQNKKWRARRCCTSPMRGRGWCWQ